MERVRHHPQPRASSPTDPNEWTITEDGFRFGVGDRVYNYYDGEWVIVLTEPDDRGWFNVRREGFPASGGYSLNSVRIAANMPSR